MFNKIKPEKELKNHLTLYDKDAIKRYLVRHINDYVRWNLNEPEHINMVCQLVGALYKVNEL